MGNRGLQSVSNSPCLPHLPSHTVPLLLCGSFTGHSSSREYPPAPAWGPPWGAGWIPAPLWPLQGLQGNLCWGPCSTSSTSSCSHLGACQLFLTLFPILLTAGQCFSLSCPLPEAPPSWLLGWAVTLQWVHWKQLCSAWGSLSLPSKGTLLQWPPTPSTLTSKYLHPIMLLYSLCSMCCC